MYLREITKHHVVINFSSQWHHIEEISFPVLFACLIGLFRMGNQA